MRLMLSFSIPVERGNSAAADGSLREAIDTLLEQTDAEAAYFALNSGQRSGIVIFELDDQARLTAINEAFFAAVDASIEIQPVLTPDDLRRGLSNEESS